MRYESDVLKHYGVPGQKWGLRRYQNEDGSLTEEGKRHYGYYDRGDGTKDMKRLKKDAANDAKEYARAKAYYGEGAGNRRKQIRNKISERMKDPDYKAEFDRQMSNQNMAEHQRKANRERKVQDTKNRTAKIARGLKNLLLGVGTTSVAAIAIYTTAKNLHSFKSFYGPSIMRNVKSFVSKMKHAGGPSASYGPGATAFTEFLNRRGM